MVRTPKPSSAATTAVRVIRGRIQYKRIKAGYLMEAGEPAGIEWALDLLTEVTADPDAYHFERASAFEMLAEARRKAGQWELAVQALEQCIELAAPEMSGTSGAPDLTLAEVLLENDPGALPRVASLLDSDQLVGRIRFNSQLFRYLVAAARGRRILGQDPAPLARRALDLLEDGPRSLATLTSGACTPAPRSCASCMTSPVTPRAMPADPGGDGRLTARPGVGNCPALAVAGWLRQVVVASSAAVRWASRGARGREGLMGR
jgi:hypothetical protein